MRSIAEPRGNRLLYQVVVTFSITYLALRVGSSTTDILLLLVVAHVVHLAIVTFRPRGTSYSTPRQTAY